jgi:hypothetical protein
MYLLGGTLGARRLGAFLAGVTFQFSGFLIVSVVHPMIIAAASWLPLLLALVELTIRREPFLSGHKDATSQRTMLPWALVGAIALGLETLAGHAEITYFTLLVVSAFAAWRLTYQALTLPRDQWKAEVVSPALGVAMIIGLGLGLSAVQYLPLYEVVQSSFRQGTVTLQQVLEWAYPKRRILTFLVPNFFGNPTHRTLYDISYRRGDPGYRQCARQPIQAFDWASRTTLKARLPGDPAASAGTAGHFEAARGCHLISAGPWLQKVAPAPLCALFHRASRSSRWAAFLAPRSMRWSMCSPVQSIALPLPLGLPLTVSIAALVALGAETIKGYRASHGPDREAEAAYQPRLKGILRLLMLNTAPTRLVSPACSPFGAASFCWAGCGSHGWPSTASSPLWSVCSGLWPGPLRLSRTIALSIPMNSIGSNWRPSS